MNMAAQTNPSLAATSKPTSPFPLTQPESYSVYVALLALSTIIVIVVSTVLLMFLYLSYKRWVNMMKIYNQQFVRMECFPPEVRMELASSYHSIDSYVESGADDTYYSQSASTNKEGEPSKLYSQTAGKNNPKKEEKAGLKSLQARIANIQYPDLNSQHGFRVIEAVELEPKNVDDLKRNIDKIRKHVGVDMELGRLSFSIEYITKLDELIITEIQGEGIRKTNSLSIVSPYVSILIWPDSSWSIKTKKLKKTNSPKWNDKIVITNFDESKMKDKALHFIVYNHQRMRPNDDIIGHVILPFEILNLKKIPKHEKITKNLQSNLKVNKGTLKVLLLYKVDDEEIEISIMKANIIYDSSYSEDQLQFFAKITVTVLDNLIFESKTKTIHGTKFPEWNESFTSKISLKQLQMALINITVRENSFVKDGKAVAYVELGLKKQETDKIHLHTAMNHPNMVISQWHQLVTHI